MGRQAIAPGDICEHLGEFAVAQSDDLVTWRQQIGDGRFHRAAPCSVYRQDWLLCIEQPLGFVEETPQDRGKGGRTVV